MSLVLASASAARRRMLEDAGLVFDVIAPVCDEEAAKRQYRAQGRSPHAQAESLAELKARSVSQTSQALVIGADQMLAVDGVVLDKPKSAAEAREHLLLLRGRTHELITAAVVAKEGAIVWRVTEAPRLRMRNFSDAFLQDYLDRAGDDVLRSVGAYQLEGLGAQLFERVEGDYFSVLGLPLVPLLTFLRGQGELSA
ncbi:MAG: septum formation protein Maf [Proteobacteria bacterium]|nr:septum formation protein Maf [Pseudomonadota bacterium]